MQSNDQYQDQDQDKDARKVRRKQAPPPVVSGNNPSLPTTRKKSPPLNNPYNINTVEFWVFMLSAIASKFGLRGVVIIVGLGIFVNTGTDAQKRELIDKLLLFKFDKNNYGYIFYVAIVFFIFFIWTVSNLKRRIKDQHEEIARLKSINHDLMQKSKK